MNWLTKITTLSVNLYRRDIIISYIIYCPAALITYYATLSIEDMMVLIKSTAPSNTILLFLGSIFVFSVVLLRYLYFFKNSWLKKHESTIIIAGESISGVFRALAGVFLGMFFIWFMEEPETLTIPVTVQLLYFGILSPLVSALLSAILLDLEKTNNRGRII